MTSILGGGGSSGITLISSVTTSGAATNATFSSIPGTYSSLLITALARSATAATNDPLNVQFNGDTGSNYSSHVTFGAGASGTTGGNTDHAGTTAGFIEDVSGATATANFASGELILIPAYTQTTFNKVYFAASSALTANSATNLFVAMSSGFWNNTAAITSIKFFLNSGAAFVNGSYFGLYGLQ